MNRINDPGRALPGLLRLSACLLGSMLITGVATAWQTPPADEQALAKGYSPTMYRVINLRPAGESLTGGWAFNARNQLAFSTVTGFVTRGWFYDGRSLVDIGSLNGRTTGVSDLNDAGQIAGTGFIRDVGTPENPGEIYHAFIWSRAGGMRDLGTLGRDGSSVARAMNNLGQVVGHADAPDGRSHAFIWNPREGMRDLGLLDSRSDSFSTAIAINDAGEVAGASGQNDNSNYHAFRWTRQKGLQDLGTLGGTSSVAWGISEDGLIAGQAALRGNVATHAFAWTRRSGMRDIGPSGRDDAFVQGVTPNGHVFGFLLPDDGRRAFSWTREGGMRILGTLGGSDALSSGGNNKREVVGGSFTAGDLDFHAVLWTPKGGVIDLNTRLRNAPAGLVLRDAATISDDGYILAESNAGLVLLVPDSCPTRTQSVGPVVANGLVPVGRPFASSVSTASEDKAASHNVLWNWGDGSGDQQGSMRMREGSGAASAQHAYAAPGVYTLQAKVADRSGQGAAVSRTVVAYEAAPGVTAASGWFMSPRGAHKAAGSRVDRVDLSFLFPSGGKAAPRLSLNGTGLQFSSEDIRMVKQSGARGFEGSGSLNGRSGYRFSLNTAAGATGATGRVGLKIWHTDPASGAVVVDYDNAGSNRSGSAFRGEIRMH